MSVNLTNLLHELTAAGLDLTDFELSDADLEQIAAGMSKGGGGGGGGRSGGGGDPVMQGFNRLNAFANWQWQVQRNTGTNTRTYGGYPVPRR
jgi:hypothetical protein